MVEKAIILLLRLPLSRKISEANLSAFSYRFHEDFSSIVGINIVFILTVLHFDYHPSASKRDT